MISATLVGWRQGVLCLGCGLAALGAPNDTLDLRQYVHLAVDHNPQIQVAASTVQAGKANQESSAAKLLPHADASADVSRAMTQGVIGGTSTSSTTTAGLSAQQLVFDFGKSPFEYLASRKSTEAAVYDQNGILQTTVLNAMTAYFGYLLAAQVLTVDEEALKQTQAHLEQAKALFEVGNQAQYTVTKAKVDVANASVNVINARSAVSLALIQLETAAGVDLRDGIVLTDSLGAPEDSLALDPAVDQALKARPEMLSAQASVESARLQLKASRFAFFPAVNASAGYGWRGTYGSSLDPNWSVGASVDAPLFEGGSLHAAFVAAQASLAKSQATLEATTQTVTQEVHQHYLEMVNARQSIDATAELIQEATEGLQLSQERFRAGAAASIEITDAEVALANARISHLQAQRDYRVAHANLLRAIGILN